MAIYYIDPIGGSDSNNDGLSEVTAFNSMAKGLQALGFLYDVDGVLIAAAGTSVVGAELRVVRGAAICPNFVLVVGSDGKTLTIRGANNAIILFTENRRGAIITLGAYAPAYAVAKLVLQNIRVGAAFQQEPNTLILRESSSGNSGYPNYHPYTITAEAAAVNCAFRGFSVLGLSTASNGFSTSFCVSEAPVSGLGCISGGDQLDELGAYSWVQKPEHILAGNGCFLPQQNGNYGYVPAPYQTNFLADGWANDPTYGLGVASIGTNQVSIQTGLSARALSPVYFYPEGISFSTTGINGLEDESRPSGAKEVLDSTPADSLRTIDVRVSDTVFTQFDAAPAWIAIPKNSTHQLLTGKYVQQRITLTTEGV